MPLLHRHTLLEPTALRVDLAVQQLTQVPRTVLRGLFSNGCITLNSLPCTEPAARGSPGDRIDVRWDPATRYRDHPKPRVDTQFRVAFEDKHLIVVEKVAGILTVPTDRRETDTLVHRVARHLSRGPRITQRAWIVHRLDRDTSGLLVFGKSEEVAARIKDQFEARKPARQYAALVAGRVQEGAGTFRSWLHTDEALDQVSRAEPGAGKLAITHYRVAERLRGATFVRVTLETGRRNQIRVHFGDAGHPVLGDVRYHSEQARHALWTAPRLALHAQTLGFVHPVTGQPVAVTSELPETFDRFLRAAR
ncbi:MAG: RluA family pseudouridine synthase [Myxococcales bacterium]|nr:RluA family pseudouridine synthase [Myxococcales bacterium]